MLSYVIPAQETSASNGRSPSNRGESSSGGGDTESTGGVPSSGLASPPRNSLSLRLNSQYMAGGDSHTEVDALLANVASGHEFCDDERTHLLNDTNHTSSPVRVKRQNSNGSNNNNSFSLNNNAAAVIITSSNTSTSTRRGAGGGGGGASGNGDDNGCGDDVVNVNVCGVVSDDVSDDALLSHHNADGNGKLPAQQDESQNPRQQTITTKKPKLSKLGSNKTVGLKRLVCKQYIFLD